MGLHLRAHGKTGQVDAAEVAVVATQLMFARRVTVILRMPVRQHGQGSALEYLGIIGRIFQARGQDRKNQQAGQETSHVSIVAERRKGRQPNEPRRDQLPQSSAMVVSRRRTLREIGNVRAQALPRADQ